jgi:hypothetical protein
VGQKEEGRNIPHTNNRPYISASSLYSSLSLCNVVTVFLLSFLIVSSSAFSFFTSSSLSRRARSAVPLSGLELPEEFGVRGGGDDDRDQRSSSMSEVVDAVRYRLGGE